MSYKMVHRRSTAWHIICIWSALNVVPGRACSRRTEYEEFMIKGIQVTVQYSLKERPVILTTL